MKKRIASVLLCLCMALSLLPTTARAETTNVTVGGETLSSSGAGNIAYAKTNADGIVTTVGATKDNYNVKYEYENENGVLTLKNATIKVSDSGDSDNMYGISLSSAMTIKLVGANTVTAAGRANENSYGIYSPYHSLTITGNGTLTVTGGEAGANSSGVYVCNKILITGGAVTATGGEAATKSYGIYSYSITISNNAAVTAVGGMASGQYGTSCGINGGDLVSISDNAAVTAVGGRGNRSFGIKSTYTSISDYAAVTALGGTGNNASHGIDVWNSITIDDNAAVTAVGGMVGSSSGTSYGVRDPLTYNGGVFAARGGYQDSGLGQPLDQAPTLNNEPNKRGGNYNDAGDCYVLQPSGDSQTYHVAVGAVTKETGDVAGHIEWDGDHCTLTNTILVGGDSGAPLTIPAGGRLTCEGVNVVLGRTGNGIFGSGAMTIDGDGTLTAISGTSNSESPCHGIRADGDLTIDGLGRVYGIGSTHGDNSGCGISASGGIAINSDSGMALSVCGSGTAFSAEPTFNDEAGGAVLQVGALDGELATWKAIQMAQSISYAEGTISKAYGDGPFTNPLTQATVNGEVTYASDATDVATVDGSGEVTIVGLGTASITATAAETLTHLQATASYTLTVTKATITVTAKDKSAYVGDPESPSLEAPVLETDYTVAGLVGADELGGTITMDYQSDGVPATPDMTVAGTYEIAISGATAPAGGNYNEIVYVPGTLTISNRPSAPALVTSIFSGGSTTGSNLDRLISRNKTLTVTDKPTGAQLVFSTEALSGIDEEATGRVQVEIKDVSETYQTTHEGKRVYSLTVLSGSKTISTFGGSVTAALPYVLQTGEQPEDVRVWNLADREAMLEVPSRYDLEREMAILTLKHFSEYVVGVQKTEETAWVNPFSDVKETDAFYDDVAFVKAAGIMNGSEATCFEPYETATRGMLVTILYQMEGRPAVADVCPFYDVASGKYYEKAVIWAAANGIVGGYGEGEFGPEDNITREQMTAILYCYAKYKGYDVSAAADLSGFGDVSGITDYALAPMRWANAKGLLQGSDNKLMPTENAERCQVAALLRHFCENIK